MTIEFFQGENTPFLWCVRLILEHKRLSYELNLSPLQSLAFNDQELLNFPPNNEAPIIIDDNFMACETLTVVDYLEGKYPQHSVYPSNLRDLTTMRRLSNSGYSYLYPALRKLLNLISEECREEDVITLALEDLVIQINSFEEELQGNYFLGENISTADFVIYPLLALVKHIEEHIPEITVELFFCPKISAFIDRFQQLQ